MLALCDTLHFMTRGILAPSALPLIRIWNWKAAPPAVPNGPAIAGTASVPRAELATARPNWRRVGRPADEAKKDSLMKSALGLVDTMDRSVRSTSCRSHAPLV